MANNRYYNNGRAIILEFDRVVGSDAIFYPDGRHSDDTVESLILDKVKGITNKKNATLIGYSKTGNGKIEKFPKWTSLSAPL